MCRRRQILRVVNIVVALSLLLQFLVPALNPSGVYAAPLPPRSASIPRAAPAAPAGLPDLQTLFNLLVRQTLTANGWTVTSLTSQLTPTTEASGQEQSGTGQWHVEALDENRQTLTLAGTLNYQLTAQMQGNQLSSGNLTMSGTLQAANVSLVLDLKSTLENDDLALSGTSQTALKLTRNGKTSTTTLNSSGVTHSVAYNIVQSVTRTTMNRDGKTGDSTQTLTTRSLGGGESEVWLQAETTGDAVPATTLAQHLFQRVSGTQVIQYLDRFDWKTLDNHYTLQAPAAITGTFGGDLNYAITLVDQNGKTINVTQGSNPHSLNLPARRVPGVAMPLPNSVDVVSSDGRGGPAPLLDAADGHIDSQVPPAAPGCEQVSGLASAGLAFGLLAVAVGVAGSLIVLPELVVLSGMLGLISWGAFAEALGIKAARCNADPYFVAPDARPSVDVVTPAPVEITRVTGGLVTPPTAPTTPTSASPAAPVPIAPNVEYRDNAQVFVGGALLPGATVIGSWTWDSARTFGAAPSHTQALRDGPQLHYFIHATQPLTVTADDNIIQYVYLDPQHPPAEIYLQFYIGDGDGEHRAYWGEDRVQTGGVPGTAALYPMGALPTKGAWVRLRIPADQLGLVGKPINGVLYGAYGGQTWWGPTTTSNRLTDTAPDKLALEDAPTLPVTQPGAQIAFRLSQALALTVEIVDAGGAHVRTLLQNETRQPIYQVVVWDGKNDGGALVTDQPYRVRISSGGKIVEAPVTISPFTASISSPGAFSVVRGIDVPIFGEAYGNLFQHYVVDYGPGLAPTQWKTLIDSSMPTLLPGTRTLSHIRAGNLANWNVGLDDFTPYQDAGLAGVYTLRLRAIGTDGREASDSVPLIAGRLASFPKGGSIASPDGKARLSIPPLATQNSFALLALVPLAEVAPDDSWRQMLPGDKKLAGTVYEIFPADERFRQDAVLELPYDTGSPTNHLGVLLGDGTPRGWRYLGGTVDAQKQTIRVSLSEFGGTRALVAPFVADNFGPPNPFSAPVAPLAFDARSAAPAVSASRVPFAFYSDLAANAGEWAALDVAGTQLTIVRGAEAGLTQGGAALKVTRRAGGVRLVRVRATPFDAAKYPLLTFDYRIPPGYAPDLLLKSNGIWWQLPMGSDYFLSRDFRTLPAPKLIADDMWHHYQVDVLAPLRTQLPDAASFQVDEIVLGQVQGIAYRQYLPVDGGEVSSAYYVTNFAAFAPVNTTNLTFTLTPPTTAASYAVALDQKIDTTPSPNSSSTASRDIQLTIPAGASDGMWYLHVSAKNANGQWSAPTHFPLRLDRQPPQVGTPDPAPNGAGAPDFVQVPVRDAGSGVDLTKLQLQIAGKSYGIGPGFSYNPERQALQITPSLLNPAPPFIANGQKADLALSGVSDYAGNTLRDPFAWAFTADRTAIQSQAFRQLTVNGGEAPALSPDGTQAAFVSSRAGVQTVWVMRADDYTEQAKSAHSLTSGTVHSSDPAWSPDGKLLAFVSDANGAPQIWVAAPDGGGARALTAGEGTVASPTWSPDGRTLAFVRDGNLWQVNADGSGAHALTNYPERPFKGVRWQPGGQLLAVDFKLYQETIDLYNPATGEIRALTEGGQERDPEWLNASTLLYTAPAATGQPDAVWQIALDGSGAVVLAGSGQPGVSDLQAAAARDGSALALVSTRAGPRNVWLRANLQITRLDIAPSTGAPAGTPMQISYALPTDARVTLQIVGGKTLLDQAQQAKGPQTVAWDGADANGKPVPPGNYAIKLTAQVAGGVQPLERYATARVLDPANIGTLQLQINQWTSVPLMNPRDLNVQVYARGTRGQPTAETDDAVSPAFKLPAGEFDVVVSQNNVQREFDGLQVQGGKTATQPLDLQLGGLQLTLMSAPGQPTRGSVYAAVMRSDDPLHAPMAEQYAETPNFVLPPGRYDLLAEYQGVRQSVYGLVVKTAQVTQREMNLGAGTLQVTVLGFGGKMADTGYRYGVDVFNPQDHKIAIASDARNPTNFFLPAGHYDVRVNYNVTPFNPHIGGAVVRWLNGVEVQSGQTTAQTVDLHLGEVKLDFVEAPGKPADDKNLSFYLTPPGDHTNHVASALFANAATLQMEPGTYDVIADLDGTDLRHAPPVATVQVKEGQSIAQTVDLKLARIRIEVYDAPGQLSAADRVIALAYPAGTRDASFSNVGFQNPSALIVRAGVAYDVVVKLAGKTFELNGLSLEEGTTKLIQISASDFK